MRTRFGIVSVVLAILSTFTLALVVPNQAAAAPGSPGVPGDPIGLYAEDFENGVDDTPILLTDYTGATPLNQTYTAADPWLTGCNGNVLTFNSTALAATNCTDVGSLNNVRQLSYALGAHTGAADPAGNHSVTAYTEGNPGADEVEFATTSPIPLATATGRFLTFSVDTAAQNCNASAPEYQFSLVSTDATVPVGGVINACTSTKTVDVPAVGTLPARPVQVGTYTSAGSVLFSGSAVGISMTNSNASGGGNDAAFDNIKILDVTPQLDKQFSPATIVAGSTSILTFTVTNTSELASKAGWSFTDSLPDGLVIADPAAASTTCSAGAVTADPGSASVEVTGNLDAGQASCTATVTVTSDAAGTYVNGPDNVTPDGLNPPADTPLVVEPQAPALTVAKSATPASAGAVGDKIAYSFLVTNTGNVAVTDVKVNEGDFSGTGTLSAITCPATTLAPGTDTTCTATYTLTQADVDAGTVANSATATGTPPSGPPVESPPDDTTVTIPAAPALTVVKTATPDSAGAVGDKVGYSFLVTNTGNVTISDVKVNESKFTGTGKLSEITCPESTLAPGADTTCTASYVLTQADVDAGSLTNTATAGGVPPGSDTPVQSPPDDAIVTVDPAPGIKVVKSADPAEGGNVGDEITYSFLITNTGNTTLTDVKVDEGDFTGTGSLSAVSCPAEAASLASGADVTCTATYTLTQADVAAGKITNTATATGTPPGDDTPPPTSPPSEVTVDIPPAPGITVAKSATPNSKADFTVGQVITYSFLVTNTGNTTLSDVKVDEGDFTGTGSLSAVSCPATAASLAPGANTTCTAKYTLTQADVDNGKVTNTASATGTPPGDTPPPTSPPSTVTIPAADPGPGLTLVKSADPATGGKVGQVITYSFLVTNTGDTTLSDVKIDEGDFTGTGSLSDVSCPAESASLAPGAQVTCTADYTLTDADVAAGTVNNTATALGTPPGGADPVVSAPSQATFVSADPAAPPVSINTGVAGNGTGPNVAMVLTGSGILVLLILGAAAWFIVSRRRHEEQILG